MAVSRRRETPLWLDSNSGKPSTLAHTTTGPPELSTQTSGRSPFTNPVLIFTWVPSGTPAALILRASTCGVVPGKPGPAGSRFIQTTMKPPSWVAATAGLKSAGMVGVPVGSWFTWMAAPSRAPVAWKRCAMISLLPAETCDQTTMKFPWALRATAASY